jgi:hypothetical protein
MVPVLSVQHDAIARQEHSLARAVGLDDEVPLPGINAVRGAAVAAAGTFRDLKDLIGAPVRRPLESPGQGEPT